jgi:hypothetical protein
MINAYDVWIDNTTCIVECNPDKLSVIIDHEGSTSPWALHVNDTIFRCPIGAPFAWVSRARNLARGQCLPCQIGTHLSYQ